MTATNTRDPAGSGSAAEAGLAALERVRCDAERCTACRFHEYRTRVVNGIGPIGAELMFVGEGPGATEDRTGEPYTGESGQLLDRIIEAIGLAREKVFLANVVRCRVPEEASIRRADAEACRPLLAREIEAVGARLTVPLGAVAWRWFAPGDRRRLRDVRGALYRSPHGLLAPTYHPAFLLRRAEYKRDVWQDMQAVVRTLERLRAGEEPPAVDIPEPGKGSRARNPRIRAFEERVDLLAGMSRPADGGAQAATDENR